MYVHSTGSFIAIYMLVISFFFNHVEIYIKVCDFGASLLEWDFEYDSLKARA